MDNREALEHFKEQLDVFGGKHREAIELAIEALEKQIPKKPLFGKSALTNREFTFCPICERAARLNGVKFNCCQFCGQRIDWGE